MILVIGLHHIFGEKIKRPAGAQAVTVNRRYEGMRP
jgi:hypothetical protein